MTTNYFSKVVSIDDTVKAAEEVLEAAKKVRNRDQHANWWDMKVELLHIINGALETGYWVGDNYNKLWYAKHTLFKAEEKAGDYAR